MSRYGHVTYSIGPGQPTQAIKTLIAVNVVAYVLTLIVPAMVTRLGLVPADVFGGLTVWQPLTYMFLHGGLGHLLLNMLALWMFGTDLERTWGTRFFLRYYFVTGIGAAIVTLLWSISPAPFASQLYNGVVIGASGAIYGLLLAYGLYFPRRTMYVYLLFPIQARYFVLIVGAIAFLSSIGSSGGGVAHVAHLGGLIVGYLYLKGRRGPLDALKYHWMRWKLSRGKPKFDVYDGGRRRPGSGDDWTKEWKKHVH